MSVLLPVVLATSLALALFCFRWLERPASHRRALLKALPVLLLAVYALLAQAPLLLVAALLLGALGDTCLAYDGEPAFLAGLAVFLVSHLAYIALFWPSVEPALVVASAWRYAAAWTFVILLTMMLFILWRPAGKLAIPVTAYALAVIAMALSALTLKPISPSAGAALFVMSDVALAIRKFLAKPDDPATRRLQPFIWGSYYAAQLIFTLALAGLPRF
ncbi:lysoplasmalogenase family protein [Rhizobium puerariae]|uniref:Lysoplasmalogenase family protein n=1 Tax=Rhizobium puerariae TaxID=1585791 RepID=A0ABV6ASB8_9HYPH